MAPSTVWEILKEAGIEPAPERACSTWAAFLRSQADALLACDFLETVTLSGARMYVLAVIEHASRRIRILGATAHPTASWVVQAAKNLVMDLEDAGCRARLLIRDRDGKFPELFDAVLADVGIAVVLSGVQTPRMNSIMQRWVQTCRRELLDRTLIWNQRHLLHTLREFEQLYNRHRPHQGIANVRPLHPLPEPIADPDKMAYLNIRSTSASAASPTSTSMPRDLPGRGFRQVQGSPPPGAVSGCGSSVRCAAGPAGGAATPRRGGVRRGRGASAGSCRDAPAAADCASWVWGFGVAARPAMPGRLVQTGRAARRVGVAVPRVGGVGRGFPRPCPDHCPVAAAAARTCS